MQSRYTAYVLRDEDYLLRTWHSDTRPRSIDLDEAIRWTSLEILATVGGSPFHDIGIVEFRARYRLGTERRELVERSHFARLDKQWLYLNAGVVRS